jgi:phthalate 4,5-dioxygenase oxygenase subunit
MGPLYDRTQENLCVQDIAIVTARRRLIAAARDLERGIEPPGRSASDYALRSVTTHLPAEADWFDSIAVPMDARRHFQA